MQRLAFFVYGVLCHLMFLAVYAVLAAFVGGFWLPKTIDSPASANVGLAAAVNIALILGFGLQHSIMARPAFKRTWTKFVPPAIERSTYVLASNLYLILLMWLWQPINIVVWDAPSGALRIAAWSLFAAGWLLVPLVSLMINHFDLFGTRQVWLHLRGEKYEPLPFRTPLLYARMRHPLYVGWALAFWAIPTMTVGHLLFASLLTMYMLVAVLFEERDLIAHFGHRYEQYRREVPMFMPRWARRSAPQAEPIEV